MDALKEFFQNNPIKWFLLLCFLTLYRLFEAILIIRSINRREQDNYTELPSEWPEQQYKNTLQRFKCFFIKNRLIIFTKTFWACLKVFIENFSAIALFYKENLPFSILESI